MNRFRLHKDALLSLLVALGLIAASGNIRAEQSPGFHALSDGKLTKGELAAAMLTAEGDLSALLKKAVITVEAEVEGAGFFGPRAWMQMKDRQIKEVRLGEDAALAPPAIKLKLFQASLRSVARHNKIDAALIVYPGTITKDGVEQRVVAVEHEHRLGVAGLKLIPLDLQAGDVKFGRALSQSKPFSLFYDAK